MLRHDLNDRGSKGRPPEAGFTLIEVMMALAVLAVGILALTGLQIRSINQNAAARIQTEETTIASQHMELLSVLPFDHDMLSAAAEDNPHQQAMGAYHLEWSVTTPAITDTVYNGLSVKLIELTVNCFRPNARPVTYSFVRAAGGEG